MPYLSLCINVDTRDGFLEDNTEMGAMFNGCRSSDFLIDGVLNKIKFFDGFDKEIIIHVDRHNDIPESILSKLQEISDTLIVRKHTNEASFNDWSYVRCLRVATGDLVCHVDQDTACFTDSKAYVDELISHLDNHSFVSYPSHWTPRAVHDESFGHRTWASTRWFICKKETLKLDEIEQCIIEPEWGYQKYGDSPRRTNWTEHFLTLVNNDSCFYPPVELHKGAIFSWSAYKKGTLEMLNNMPYEGVKQWILHRGGIQYPVDVKCD